MSLDKRKGFTGFDLKLAALIFMLLDHIYYIFEYTGQIPVWFSWLGRLSGGLFLFTMVEGYSHTSNKKKYFTRIYLMSVGMSFVKYAMQFIPSLQRRDGFTPQNGIFQTFVILMIMFKGIDMIREKKIFKGILILLSPFILMYAIAIPLQLIDMNMEIKNALYVFLTSFIPSPFMSEGGIFVIISGLILYIFKDNRKRQVLLFFLFHFGWMTIIPALYIEDITFISMFTDYYEWMGALAAIPMLMYNGQKGRSMKSLFYIFYPVHIYILYIISMIIYK